MSLRIAIFTSSEPRHKFYVSQIASKHDVVSVVIEKKRDALSSGNTLQGADLMAEHLGDFRKTERRLLGSAPDFPVPALEVPTGFINSELVVEELAFKKPEIVLFFGTSIVNDLILSVPPHRFLNLHLGLSPYYRGTATNFWPLVNGEPELVGATIHWATLKVDGGPIVHQVRPDFSATDTVHEVGCKAIQAGAKGVLHVLDLIEQKGREFPDGKAQDLSSGKVYRRKDFNEASIIKLRENMSSDMLGAYLKSKKERDAKFPILEAK